MRLWSQLDSLIRELKRREVLRAAAVYAVTAWVAVQVATDVFPSLQLPSWTTTLVVVTAIVGFPIVIVAAWVYEVTPQGIQRTPDVDGPPELVRARGTPWVAMLLVGVVTAASVGIGWAAWGLWLEPTEGVADVDAAASSDVSFSETRIAVLPFEHAGSDADLEWLAEGITKDLIDALDDMSVLDVVSYRGVMPYRGRVPPLDSVARAHRTGNLVAGAVDEAEDRLIVRLELVDGETSSSLWSDRFVGGRDSVLALQERVLDAAVRQLRREVGEQVQRTSSRAAANDDEAWELFHRAESRAAEATRHRVSGLRNVAAETYAQADALYREAEELDPEWHAPALGRGWLALERAALDGADVTAMDADWLRRGIEHAERVLDRQPGDAAALELRGALRNALSRLPSVSDAGALQAAALEDLEAAVAEDADRARAWADLSDLYQRRGRLPAAREAAVMARNADAFLFHEVDYLRQAAHIALEVGEFGEALELARTGRVTFPRSQWPDALTLLVMATADAPLVPPDSAWSVLARMEETSGREQPLGRLQVSAALARWGLSDSARSVLDRAIANVSDRNQTFAAYYEANVRLQLGEKAEALKLLARYLEANPESRDYVSQDLWWEPLRQDSAFRALVGITD
jgi:TolB-like protein